VYNGARAEAMKGKNDDLVMALAIGTWLFEPGNQQEQVGMSFADAMLAGFGVNKAPDASRVATAWNSTADNRVERAVARDSRFINGADAYNRGNNMSQQDAYSQFGWLVGK
jgi:hypothetical protein